MKYTKEKQVASNKPGRNCATPSTFIPVIMYAVIMLHFNHHV